MRLKSNQVIRVTKTPKPGSKLSWYHKPRIRYGGWQSAIQTFIWNFDNKYDVKVELVEVTVVGEVDMEKYVKRHQVESFFK